MEFLMIIFGITLAVGLFMLLANALKIPYLKTSKAVMNTGDIARNSGETWQNYPDG